MKIKAKIVDNPYTKALEIIKVEDFPLLMELGKTLTDEHDDEVTT